MNQPKPTNYRQALAILNGKTSRKIANNTYLELGHHVTELGSLVQVIHVRLHGTNVITFHENVETVLNSGGYRSKMTKERINRYLPAGAAVTQHNFNWTYHYGHSYEPLNSVLFADGMTIDSETGEVA